MPMGSPFGSVGVEAHARRGTTGASPRPVSKTATTGARLRIGARLQGRGRDRSPAGGRRNRAHRSCRCRPRGVRRERIRRERIGGERIRGEGIRREGIQTVRVRRHHVVQADAVGGAVGVGPRLTQDLPRIGRLGGDPAAVGPVLGATLSRARMGASGALRRPSSRSPDRCSIPARSGDAAAMPPCRLRSSDAPVSTPATINSSET